MLAMRKNEILPFAAMWMELQGTMQSAASQTGGYYAKGSKSIRERDIYVFTHVWILRN